MAAVTPLTAKHEVMMELSALGHDQHCPLGVYVTPSLSIFKWDCVLFLHQGYYRSGVFHFTLTVPTSYPNSPPSVHFLTDVFHPLIDPGTGKLALNGRFPQWRPRVDFLFHVLHFVKSAFKRGNLDSLREGTCLNKEAYRLYREQTPLFTKLAAQSAQLSSSDKALFGPGACDMDGERSSIVFRKLASPEEEETLRQKVEHEARARMVPREAKWVS